MIDHKCRGDEAVRCIRYVNEDLFLYIPGYIYNEEEDECPDIRCKVNFCPFCGLCNQPERLNPKNRKMVWNHWTTQPADKQWIFVYHDPYLDDPPLMGRLKYRRVNDDVWQKMKSEPRCGWTYWMPYDAIPLPICDSLNSVVTQRGRSEEVDPPGNRS